MPLWQKQWVALAIRMKRLHLLDRDDLKDPYALVRIDCDEDTILLLVEQVGAACHTGHYSCFYRNIEGEEK